MKWWSRMTGMRRTSPVPPALLWVDEFIASVRPYIEVRLEDNLLIRMPNQAHKLNSTGAQVLDFLLSKGSMAELVARITTDRKQRLQEIAMFLHAVRSCLSGELREDNASCAVEIEPLEVGFSDLPVLSEIALTSRCNLDCTFCYAGCGGSCVSWFTEGASQGKRSDPDGPTVMSTSEVKTVLDKIRNQALVPSVSFTGGEPTLRSDLPELVSYAARDLRMRVNLITNGTLVTMDMARNLARAGLASAQVSIEGPDAVVHDRVTRVQGAFVASCQAVGHFRAAGVTVHCNTTINAHNVDAVTRMPEFAKDFLHLERLSMNMVIPAGSACRDEDNESSSLVCYSQIKPVLLDVQRAAAEAGIEFMWYSPTPLCLFNPIVAELGNKGCSACDGLLSVDPWGQILPCSSCADPVGNLLEDGFQMLWNQEKSQYYRNKGFAHPSCRQCEHFAFCHGACPLYWRHFGFQELSEACGFDPCPAPRIPAQGEEGRDRQNIDVSQAVVTGG